MPAPNKKVKLTNSILESLPPAAPGKRDTIWDTVVPSFCVRVTDRGAISFAVFRQPRGAPKPIWDTLGKYPALTLAKAREAARASVNLMMQGRNPAAERKAAAEAAKQAERQGKQNSFTTIAEKYIREHVAKLRRPKQPGAVVRNILMKEFRDRPINSIRRSEVRTLIERIRDNPVPGTGRRSVRGGEHAAAKALSALSALFTWAISKDDDDLIAANPCTGIRGSTLDKPVPRTRALNDDELRWLWQAAEAEGEKAAGTPGRGRPHHAAGVNGTLIKVLLMTGQRLREIGHMRWSEINFAEAQLNIPASRMKMKQPHMVPLSDAVIELLQALPRFAGSDLVFTLDGAKPINGFDRMKLRFDRRFAEYAGDTKIEDWRWHDLRRTARTGMSRAGVIQEIAERVIAHVPDAIVGTYDRYAYGKEKQAALEAWQALLMTIVEPPAGGGNVVPLRKTA